MRSPTNLERRPINRWDSFATDEFRHRAYLFGSGNIGRMDHCNMDVPGSLSPDLTTVIEHVYARTEAAPRDLVATLDLHRWASHAVVRLLVGDKPRRVFALADLLQERPWEPAAIAIAREMEAGEPAAAGVVAAYKERLGQRRGDGPPGVEVPVRQYVAVDIDAPDWPPGPPTRIWIHLEGFQVWPQC
ncbi:MAG: hypothetical protein IT338_17400 [Thermomicrobiales bacterium]|nr:hypothetical protein [Thermomicrobiales bacterium]